MKKKAVIFDLDGTLLDTLEDLSRSVNFVLDKFHQPLLSKEKVAGYLGNGYRELIFKSLKDKEYLNEALELFNAYYAEHLEDYTSPYPGILNAISKLSQQNIKMAIVSNKGDKEVKRLCSKFFYPHISTYIGVKEGIPKKPNPAMLKEALRLLNANERDCVMVGDGEPDVIMAKSIGMDSISVLWGFRTKEQLMDVGGKVFINSPEQFLEKGLII